MHRKRELLCSVILAAHAFPAWAQPVTSAGSSVNLAAGDRATIPNLSGTWGHYSFPGIEPPATGPGPVLNKSRRRQSFDDSGRPYRGGANAPLVSNNAQLVGDYSNPILKPQAAEAVKTYGDIELSGHPAPNPSNQCWPNAVPYAFWNLGVQILQEPDKVTILQVFNHEFREVRLNQPHPARPTPSWHGDLVGHYEGDTLVIDTVAIKIGPFAMVDHYGTPYSEALHVIERYRLVDYEMAKEALARDAKENWRFPVTNDSGVIVDPNYRGKHLQVHVTVEDPGVFTMPWSATVTYRPASGEWPEFVCAENPDEITRRAGIPMANRSEF